MDESRPDKMIDDDELPYSELAVLISHFPKLSEKLCLTKEERAKLILVISNSIFITLFIKLFFCCCRSREWYNHWCYEEPIIKRLQNHPRSN